MNINGMQLEGVAEGAIAELVALYEASGDLTAMAVLEWAEKNPESALHREFEWDDQLAAVQFRVQQARQVIARVKLRMTSDPAKTTRAFVSITTGDRRSYILATQAMADDAMRDLQVRHLVSQIGQLMTKLRQFEEFAEIVAAWNLATAE